MTRSIHDVVCIGSLNRSLPASLAPVALKLISLIKTQEN